MKNSQTPQEWFTDELESMKNEPVYIIEGTLMQFVNKITIEMEEQGISKSALAQKIGKKPPFVTRVMQGNSNITLATMVEILVALGLKFDFQFKSLEVDKKTKPLPQRKSPRRQNRLQGVEI